MKEYFYVASLRVLKELLTYVPFLYHETLTDDERVLSFRLFNRGYSVTRRIDNLLQTHDQVMNFSVDSRYKGSFMRLQSFQFEYLSDEITNVAQGVMTLAGFREQTDRGELHMYCELIRELVLEVKKQLDAEAPKCELRMPLLTTKQISVCRSEYSHPIEFIILDWFVNPKLQAIPEKLLGPPAVAGRTRSTPRNILSQEVRSLILGKSIEN